VIDAAGMWGREIAAMVGTRVPACAVEHQYFVTEKSEKIPDNLPTLRDPDGSFYLKPEPGAFAVGGWEHNTPPWGANGIRADFGPELLQADFERFSPLAEAASARIPLLNEVGIRQLINGPDSDHRRRRADHRPLAGARQFLSCAAASRRESPRRAAQGWVMANWIVDGDPGLDLWPFDIRRFGAPHSVKQYMYERAVESYGRYYHIAWPTYEADAARGARRSPLYARLAEAGAVYGNKFGWERPNWFAPPGTPAIETPSFERGPAFDAIGAEHRAVRERVGLIDMSSFSKYEVRGPGALALLQRLAVNNLDRPVGTIVYTQLCNERGGIEADVTITRLADDRFYFVTGSALGVRDRSTIERHLPADGSVEIVEHTSAKAVINCCGPRSREVLAKLTDAPLDNAHFPVHERARARSRLRAGARASRHLPRRARLRAPRAGRVRARALRAAVGSGRAVRHRQRRLPRDQQPAAREALSRLGLGPHAGLQSVRGGARFLRRARQGRVPRAKALEQVKTSGPMQKLTWFDAPAELNLFGGEIVAAGDRVLGNVKSGGYGYTVGRNLCCAYIAATEPVHSEYAIE
jgi:4-methylaminobutanoate oxidase (formaldehyde-forming)